MRDYRIGREQIDRYAAHLRREERSPGTVENYLRHARTFAAWLNGRPVTRERAAEWKEHLLSKGCAPVTVNAMLAALNGLFRFLGWDDCRVKFLKLQRRLFRATERELTRAEYDRLLSAARCCNTPGNRTPPPVRSFSPEAEKGCPASRSGRR